MCRSRPSERSARGRPPRPRDPTAGCRLCGDGAGSGVAERVLRSPVRLRPAAGPARGRGTAQRDVPAPHHGVLPRAWPTARSAPPSLSAAARQDCQREPGSCRTCKLCLAKASVPVQERSRARFICPRADLVRSSRGVLLHLQRAGRHAAGVGRLAGRVPHSSLDEGVDSVRADRYVRALHHDDAAALDESVRPATNCACECSSTYASILARRTSLSSLAIRRQWPLAASRRLLGPRFAQLGRTVQMFDRPVSVTLSGWDSVRPDLCPPQEGLPLRRPPEIPAGTGCWQRFGEEPGVVSGEE